MENLIHEAENFLEAEQAVIGGLLADNSLITEVDLTPFDFHDQSMAQIFGVMKALERDEKPFDVFTVADALAARTGKDWTVTVAQIARNTPSAKNIKTYAGHVKRYRKNREVRRIGRMLIDEILTDDSAIDTAISELMQLNQPVKQTVYTMKEALKLAYDHLVEVNNGGGLVGIPTGFTDLDEQLGGFHPSDLVIIGARPAMGKTGLLLNSSLSCGVPCGIQSAEMSAFQLAMRTMSTKGRVNSHKMRSADFDGEEWARIGSAFKEMVDLPIFIDEQPSPTIGEVQRQARMLKQKYDIKIFYVDYLQRLRGNNDRENRIDQVGEIARGLKSLARELNIPVVALAQVNRAVDTRPDKRPFMGDLANSSEIEKEADVIMMLYRDEVYNDDSPDTGIAEINIEKNRHGPTGQIRLAWIAKYMQFADLVQRWKG